MGNIEFTEKELKAISKELIKDKIINEIAILVTKKITRDKEIRKMINKNIEKSISSKTDNYIRIANKRIDTAIKQNLNDLVNDEISEIVNNEENIEFMRRRLICSDKKLKNIIKDVLEGK